MSERWGNVQPDLTFIADECRQSPIRFNAVSQPALEKLTYGMPADRRRNTALKAGFSIIQLVKYILLCGAVITLALQFAILKTEVEGCAPSAIFTLERESTF